jgi:calcium/calmodulin-dependent protein kinase I
MSKVPDVAPVSNTETLVKAGATEGGLRTGQYNTTDPLMNYKFGRTLGKGSFATVRVVTCLQDGSKWACKIIDKKALNQEDKDALQVEVDTMMKVNHDHIVTLKEVYDTASKFYMILELCQGGELFDRIVQLEHYSETQAMEAFTQMVEAVGHCHMLSIVHRDLKPENLLYQDALPNMCLKLADFGLAQIVSPSNRLHTACGTPGYVAPEILKGRNYDQSVDIWSLGVILYILLCGFPPFYEEHTPDLFRLIKKGQYEFPEPYWDDVSEGAKDLIRKLLVVDPKDRYTAAQIFEHPWMQPVPESTDADGAVKPKPLIHFQGNLKKYNARRKFKGIVEGVMMTNIMKNLMTQAKKLATKKLNNVPEGEGGEAGTEGDKTSPPVGVLGGGLGVLVKSPTLGEPASAEMTAEATAVDSYDPTSDEVLEIASAANSPAKKKFFEAGHEETPAPAAAA